MQLYDHLLRIPLFQGMSRDNLAQVVGHTRFGFHKYEPMRWIAKEGDKCSQLSFLLAGTIQSTTFSDDHVYSVVEQVGTFHPAAGSAVWLLPDVHARF